MNVALVALVAAFLGNCAHAQSVNSTVRTYYFHAKPLSIPLGRTLPPNTQLFKTWPPTRHRVDLPDSIAAVTVHDHNNDNNNILIGPPIHVQSGDRLKLTLKNDVPYTGLSLHLHGLGFAGKFEYDGAVGVSQCPLAEGNEFVYDVVVDDNPGTYWYHTSSGHFGVDAYDAIRGPLIVHPKGNEGGELVNILNDSSQLPSGYSPIDQHILFLQDGFLSSASLRYSEQVGRLVPPPSKSDDGLIVATSPWEFGTSNGKLRDVVHVTPNKKYLVRVINGGQHQALRFSIDGFPLTVVAADGQPVEAYTVDQLVLHVGERFDVEVFIFEDLAEGERFWIRADTLESTSQGFQNGIRAILRVSAPDPQLIPLDEDVSDPQQSIETPVSKYRDIKTMNCHGYGCVPITDLSPLSINQAEVKNEIESEIHTVDTHFQPSPQYGHFVGVDESALTQNELPPAAMISRTFRPAKSVHPHSMALRAGRSSSVIIVWRTTLLMDVPIHLHGHTVEILDMAYPVLHRDCTLQSCRLSQAYEERSKLKALDKTMPNQAVKKDTFVIPAGGAVVTRMRTGNRGLWLVHGQKDIHNEDGMSLVLIVGDYRIPGEDAWPSDFPTCNSTLVHSMTMQPNCGCYTDKNAPLQQLESKMFCSRSHLCRHELSQTANLDSYVYDSGLNIQSGWVNIPDIIVAAIFFLVLAASAVLVVVLPSKRSHLNDEPKSNYDKMLRRLSSMGIGSRLPQKRTSHIDVNVMSNSRQSSSSILGLSVVASNHPESHIGTVDELYEDEEVDDADDSDYDADMPPPPPPPANPATGERIQAVCLPPLPQRSLNSGTSTWDLFRSRRSSVSTFDRIFSEREGDSRDNKQDLDNAFEFLLDSGYSVKGKVDIIPVMDEIGRGSSLKKQFLHNFSLQWCSYFPGNVNLLRVVEVAGLATITGLVFRSAGSDNSQATVGELSSLVLVLTTTWTFSRLFSSIQSYSDWFKSIQVIFRHKRFAFLPVFVARSVVVALCESVFPMIAVCICLPVAGLLGDLRSMIDMAFLLSSNSMCYLSLGAVLGMFTSVPHAMIAATIFSQVSILASGVFTELPESSQWVRYLSPFYWTVQGLLKCVYRWSDTYECVNGSSSDVGANQCFIEYDPLVEQYKRRGLHVATYGDPASDSVLTESFALAALCFVLQMIIQGRVFFAYYQVNWDAMGKGKRTLLCTATHPDPASET